MFPIRDHNPSERTPFVTYGLIAMNLVVFLLMLPTFGEQSSVAIYNTYGITPAEFGNGGGFATLFTHMFVHGGFMHFIGNMLFLWIFGDNLEDILGHVKFVLFYLGSGICAALAQYLGDPSSTVPMVGASGAIAGVMGGYLLLFPKARVDILFIIIIFFKIFPAPAWLMLLLWFGLQVVNGALSLTGAEGGVAYLAHAGGFIAGFVLMMPKWMALGGQGFWSKTDGHPDHPEAAYRLGTSNIPKITRNR